MEANNSGRIIPHEGADLEYDSANKTVREIESTLKKHLKDQRKLLGDSSVWARLNLLMFYPSVVYSWFYFIFSCAVNNNL